MMTRKDYETIASAIRQANETARANWIGENAEIMADGIWLVARFIAEDCEQNNPRFDTRRFLQTCGVRH